MKKRILTVTFIILFTVGAILRWFNPFWDEEHYLHPDERLYINASNISMPKSIAEFLSPSSFLNPHMFYYGELPLFIYVSFFKMLNFDFGYAINLLPLSRIISASFSVISIILLFKLTELYFSRKTALLSALFFTFSVGSIQYAHYNTTESALTMLSLLLSYLSILFIKEYKKGLGKNHFLRLILLSFSLGITTGASVATKITGLSFAIIPFCSFVLVLCNAIKLKKDKLKNTIQIFSLGIVFIIFAGVIAFLGSPYNLIDYPSFQKEQSYMQNVILGVNKPPFTIIYEYTKPYVYQLTKILPWIYSPFSLIAAILGLLLLIYIMIRTKDFKLLIILLWPIIYFVTIGNWYAKFTRYMIPLLPYLAIYTAFLFHISISFIRNNKWRIFIAFTFTFLVSTQMIYSLGFVKEIYYKDNTRLAASRWIFNHIPVGSTLGTEHWDDPLPVSFPNYNRDVYKYIELTVYNPDNEKKNQTLADNLSRSQYLVFSSRRVYYSILRNSKLYPFTSNFYRSLFSEKLGFKLIHREAHYPSIGNYILNDDIADESFQSYDHPPVVIFQNIDYLNSNELIKRIQMNQLKAIDSE